MKGEGSTFFFLALVRLIPVWFSGRRIGDKGVLHLQALGVSFPQEENGIHSTRACYCHSGPTTA